MAFGRILLPARQTLHSSRSHLRRRVSTCTIAPYQSSYFSTVERQLSRRTLQSSVIYDSSYASQHAPATSTLYTPQIRLSSRLFSTTPVRLKDELADKSPVYEAVKEENEKAKEEETDKETKDEEAKVEEVKEQPKEQPKPVVDTPTKSVAENKSSPTVLEPPASSSPPGSKPPGSDGKSNGGKTALQKPTVPEIYPRVMALPIAKRPLFPGFYKAVTIRDPAVASAIQEMMKRGQPYLGVFLFKNDDADADTITSADEVHDVGVFAQITSAFPVQGEENSLTAVLYPHRRIKLSNLLPPQQQQPAESEPAVPEMESKVNATSGIEADAPSIKTVLSDAAKSEAEGGKGDVVASFEEVPEDTIMTKTSESIKPPKSYATSFLQKYPVSLVDVENLVEEPHDKKNPVIRAVTSEIVNVFKDVANSNPLFRDQVSTFSMSQSAGNVIDEPAKLADFAAAVSAGEVKELQEVLETLNVEERLQKALLVLKKELMNAQLQSKISKDVESKIQKRQREYWLMEQMKGIRRELGIESDGKDRLVEKFKEKSAKLAMPDAVKKVFDEEINKLAHLETAASEFNVTRNYLDWLTQIPWGQRSAENYSIKNAMTVLDEDHHGLKDVKDRILESIAVGKLRGSVEGKILCFVGPPGVGKTSIGKSIARALQREFYRFSVGGLTDVAEIKGHRRTYVGALPGRIIQALKKCQTENPLILIDEIDKIGRGHQGDPASALLELLDPEQNNSFLDHYMDVPVDLSKVLFVCTANINDTIPRPLLDRMEMIELSGYVADEKMSIAEKYLAPAAKQLSGLGKVDVQLEKEAIEELIKNYCRESGVRNLKKQIEKVYRKAALKIVTDLGEEVFPESKAMTEEGKAAQKETNENAAAIADPKQDVHPSTTEIPRVGLDVPESVHVKIDSSNLKDYVGAPVYTSDRLYEITPPGVAMGLAWTQMGGSALYIESILEAALGPDSRPGFERTGNLQNVMKESTIIAYSFAKSFMAKQFPKNKFFEKARVHLHCPEGAVPKDGPSAGITMATSLLSLAFDYPISPTVAMTGELTVTGKVLRIGGLREKSVAARRSGANMIMFPADNMSDWLELPDNIKEGLEGRPVSWYSDVYNIIFENLDKEKAATQWSEQLKEDEKTKKSRKRRIVEEEEEDDD